MSLLNWKLKGFKKFLSITSRISNESSELAEKHREMERAVKIIERINNNGFDSIYAKSSVLSFAKEIREVTDIEEAARLVQSGNWIIVHAAKKENGIMWVLIRLGAEDPAVVQDE